MGSGGPPGAFVNAVRTPPWRMIWPKAGEITAIITPLYLCRCDSKTMRITSHALQGALPFDLAACDSPPAPQFRPVRG